MADVANLDAIQPEERALREGGERTGGGTTTHRIMVDDRSYTSISNGNVNCTMLVKTNQSLRMIISSSQPLPEDTDYIAVSGPGGSTARANVVSGRDLYAGDAIWVRTEVGETEVRCIRGPAIIDVSLAG